MVRGSWRSWRRTRRDGRQRAADAHATSPDRISSKEGTVEIVVHRCAGATRRASRRRAALPRAAAAGAGSDRPLPSRGLRPEGNAAARPIGETVTTAPRATRGRDPPSAHRAQAAVGCRSAPRRARPSPAGRPKPAHPRVGLVGKSNVVDYLGDAVLRGAHDDGQIVEVLSYREVAVDRWSLGDISHLCAKRSRAGRPAEHADSAGHDPLNPHDRSNQRRLAGTAGPQETGDRAGPYRAGKVGQHRPPAAQ